MSHYNLNQDIQKLSKAQYLILFLYLVITACIFGIHRNPSFDTYWLIKLGEIIFTNLSFAKHELLSYTASGTYWVNLEWLSASIIYLYYHIFGETAGLIIYQVTFILLLEIALLLIVRLYTSKIIYSILVIPLVLLVCSSRFTPRPHLMSFFFFAFFIYIWAKSQKTNNYKYLYYLIPLYVLWFNLHGAAKISLVVLFLFWLGELIDFLSKRQDSVSKKFLIHTTIVIALCFLGGLINPFGLEAYIYTYQSTFGELRQFTGYISEWVPVLSEHAKFFLDIYFLPLALIIIGFGFFGNRQHFRLSHALGILAVFYLNWKAVRFAPYLAILGCYITIYNLKDFKIKHEKSLLYFMLFLTWLTIFKLSYDTKDKFYPLQASGGVAPKELVNFLEENDIHGHPFHNYPLGAYLSFRRWPKEKIFMDGRTHVYGVELFQDYLVVFSKYLEAIPVFEKLKEKYDIDYIIFTVGDIKKKKPLASYLLNQPEWKLVYSDEYGLVLLKDIPKFKPLIAKFEQKELDPKLLKKIEEKDNNNN
ncbi:MAG: hypothetical protein ABH859_03875 [Pseudomonadota bacterium]